MNKINHLINNIKNSHNNFKHFVKYPASNLILEICNLFLTENFIRGYFIENKNIVVILLRYNMNKQIFSQILVKVQRFKFKKIKKNFKFTNGLGVEIFSTTKGINTGSKVLKLNLGGQKIMQLF